MLDTQYVLCHTLFPTIAVKHGHKAESSLYVVVLKETKIDCWFAGFFSLFIYSLDERSSC